MSSETATFLYRCELAAVQELGVSNDEFWMMTMRELKMRIKGSRKRLRQICGFHALVAHCIIAANSKGRPPSVGALVNKLMGPPERD